MHIYLLTPIKFAFRTGFDMQVFVSFDQKNKETIILNQNNYPVLGVWGD